MTIIEAINRIDALKHNTYSQSEKVIWLSNVDRLVKTQVIDTHEGGEEVVFEGYTENTSFDTELLIPAPYEEVYMRWLEAQIDYYNGEYDKYNNAVLMYNTEFQAFERWYNRTHMPKGDNFKYF